MIDKCQIDKCQIDKRDVMRWFPSTGYYTGHAERLAGELPP